MILQTEMLFTLFHQQGEEFSNLLQHYQQVTQQVRKIYCEVLQCPSRE